MLAENPVIEVDGEEREVSLGRLADELSPEQMAELLEEHANRMGMEREGLTVGRTLARTHRTLPGSVVNYLLNILEGLGEQKHTDARNKQAIEACRIITEQRRNGDIPYQPFI